MMMLECDAKRLLASAGVNVPQGTLWRKGDSAQDVQVSSFGRSQGAGARARAETWRSPAVNDPAALAATAAKLFETEFSGEKPEAPLIEPWLAIERETYLSVAVDGRAEGYVVHTRRAEGRYRGSTPPVRYAVGAPWNFRVHGLREVLEDVEPDYQWREKVIALAQRLIRIAAAHDCTTVEINPLVKLADGAMIAADAKIALDEWAAFRNNRISDEYEARKQRADPYLRACLTCSTYIHLTVTSG
jgi:succinyl-CoA synthetase beta subunit